MKKLFLILIATVLILSLCSCAILTQTAAEGGTVPEDEPSGEYTEDLADPDPSDSYTEPEIPEEPTDEELNDLIVKYLEFESYIKYTTPAVDYNSRLSDDPESNEYYMVRITDPRIATPEDWENYLGSIFALGASSATVSPNTPWVVERIVGHDGAMYALDAGVGWPYTDEYVVTGMYRDPTLGIDWLSAFFAREMEPMFRTHEDESEYLVIRFELVYTKDGWRITEYTEIPVYDIEWWPDYIPKENIENYYPFD